MPDDARSESELVLALGPAHALMIEHFTNMTAMQQRVCQAAVQEYRDLQAEHVKVMVELARATQKLMVVKEPQLLKPPEAPRPKRKPRTVPALRVRPR